MLDLTERVAVMDCVMLWLTNFYVDTHYNAEASLQQAKDIIDQLVLLNTTLIIISNEIGMGVHAETEIGRKFVELQGWTNQYIASTCNKAFFMVSGIALPLK